MTTADRRPPTPDRRQPLLSLTGVAKSYAATDAAAATPVLREVDLHLAVGEVVAIIGPSGSGKSTLLNIIGTLDRPDCGHVLLDDRDLTTLNERELAAVRCCEIGFVFQLHHLLPQCTVLENVLVPTLAMRDSTKHEALPAARSTKHEARSRTESGSAAIDRAEGAPYSASCPSEAIRASRFVPERSEERARRLLARVGLAQRLAHRPGQLSGGERQRVAVARALINQPRLLLADEPTGSLDRGAADDLAKLLIELNCEEHVALIVVTHTPSLAERMTRVLELRDGALVRVGDAQ
jgi:lipoprotein-releasing system ATP-binding protein